MLKLTQRIADDFDASHKNGVVRKNLTSGEITELLYKHNIMSLQQQVVDYLSCKDGLWILFDNLDKGWPAHGVTNEDVTTLRCLIEALRKIERQMSRRKIECHGVVFMRNDIYELLVENTPDRGKTVHIALDWTDSELLRELMRRRFIYNDIQGLPSFEEIWRQICISHIKGEETSQYIIERSLMRPRGLIELLRACRSRAVNLEHSRIEVSDIEEGEKTYSNELLNNIGFEIRDIFPIGADILYQFIEAPVELSREEIHSILAKEVGNNKAEQLFELLIWYGFLGLVREDQEITYIYQVHYNINIFRTLIERRGGEMARFRINPAFWKALEVHHP